MENSASGATSAGASRYLGVGESVEVVQRLTLGLLEVAPGRFHLDDGNPGDESVDVAAACSRRPSHALLVQCGTRLRDAVHPEQVSDEALCVLALVAGGVLPVEGETRRAASDLVQG
jgi:hypothetical protein